MDPRDIPIALTVVRTLAGRSLQEMAAAANIEYSQLSRFESGQRRPAPADMERLCIAAGLPSWAIAEYLLPLLGVLRRLAARPERPDRPGLAARLPAIFEDQELSARAMAALAEFLVAPGAPVEPGPSGGSSST